MSDFMMKCGQIFNRIFLLHFFFSFKQIDFDPEQDSRNQRYSRQAYEDDDDGYHHGPRVQQCTSS